jgi:glycosyltransferase involved in cell wall biosynthesis
VHDWLTGMRGGEKCLEVFCELFPSADLYTLIHCPERISPSINAMKVHRSWLNRLPGIRHYYRYCLPLFPQAIERLKLDHYDLVLSSSHCVAKGVFPQGALHISYIYSPMRYIWDMYDVYFGPHASWAARIGMSLWRRSLQRWDVRSAARVHFLVAISHHIARKIRTIYRRDAAIIHPPVDVERFYVTESQEPYYLVVSALVPYKRVDLAVDAFNELKLPLKIVGEGPLKPALQRRAGKNVEFLGWVTNEALARLYASCQALVFPGEEDFGIVSLEAHASGRPVIAYGRGGVLETVIPLAPGRANQGTEAAPTGMFFPQLAVPSLVSAVESFEVNKHLFDPNAIRARALSFSRERFKEEIRAFLNDRLTEWKGRANRVA